MNKLNIINCLYLSILSSLVLVIFNICYNSHAKYHKYKTNPFLISIINLILINVINFYIEWKSKVLIEPFV